MSKSEYISALQQLYATLEEPDLVLGVASMRDHDPSLGELIQLHEATGNYQDALSCYKLHPGDPFGHVQMYLNIDQPHTAAAMAARLGQYHEEISSRLAPLQVEAAWQLGNWEDVNKFSKYEEQPLVMKYELDTGGWEVQLGQVLMAVKNEEWTKMKGLIDKCRCDIVESLSSGSLIPGAYYRNYNIINKLGMLNEVEMIAEKFLMSSIKQLSSASLGTTELLSELSYRLLYTQKSWNVVEPILRLRRCCFGLARDRIRPYNGQLADRLDYEIGESWIKSARLARESGQVQESYSLLIETKKFKHPETFLEFAKLSWDRGQKTEAVNILNKGISDNFSVVCQALSDEDVPPKTRNSNIARAVQSLAKGEKEVLCQGKLLLAKYLEESRSVSSEEVSSIYSQIKLFSKTDEEVYFSYARSLDKQIQRLSPEQQIQHADLIYHTIIGYIRSIHNGPTYIHHALPRMLTLWLDYTEVIENFTKTKGKDVKFIASLSNASNNMDQFIDQYSKWSTMIPSYYFLTALPQLISRICHIHAKSYNLLSKILVNLLSGDYCQQTFWHLVSVSKNRDNTRKNRCLTIIQEAMNSSPAIKSFLTDALALAKKLDELCDIKTEKGVKSVSLKEIFKSLPALINKAGASKIIFPNHRNLSITLPTLDANVQNHQPFPRGLVYIEAIEDEVLVMPSLVQPKKITFRGSDGHLYSFLAKPKDDLRRDSRLMDYIWLLNKLFRKDSQARSRNLHVRTYAVVPTNETSGLIEWVDNLKAIRPIILQLHKEEGRHLNQKWATLFQTPDTAPLAEKKKKYLECLESQEGPVFSNWFVKNFPDPQSWFMARMAFVRSTAVMSMMGYIIGLGDRHLENINVDTTTGDTFHVDMNCLFNKGETLAVPEVVPFRLTHNMVDVFGPVGVEGPFRIACEIALKVMRDEKDVLMSMLRPFIYDPLVDWAKGSKTGGVDTGKTHLTRVEDRLSGVVTDPLEKKKDEKRSKKTLINHALSVEGQVSHVINEATTVNNLAVMYWGWAPYL